MQLDAEQFQRVVGDDFQTLILSPQSDPSERSGTFFAAPFHNDQQRALWTDSQATHLIRFECSRHDRSRGRGREHRCRDEPPTVDDFDETGCSRVYADGDLLGRIDRDLAGRTIRYQLPLVAPTPGNAILRAVQGDEVMRASGRQKDRCPASWEELTERLSADRWLPRFIERQPSCRWIRSRSTPSDVIRDVRFELYRLVVRNAGKWFSVPNRGQDWKVWIILSVPKMTIRRTNRRSP